MYVSGVDLGSSNLDLFINHLQAELVFLYPSTKVLLDQTPLNHASSLHVCLIPRLSSSWFISLSTFQDYSSREVS